MIEREVHGRMELAPGTWRPPEHRILPEILDQARAFITAKLMPAGASGVAKAITPLLLTTVQPTLAVMHDPDDDEETINRKQQAYLTAQMAEFQRLMAHVPADIISKACDAHAMESKFFPAIAELMKHARPALELRKQQAHRIERLIAAANAPNPREAFKPESDETRHRAAVARFHKFKGGMIHDKLRAQAIESERWLAAHESREPDLEQFGTATPAVLPPPMPRRSPHSGRKQATDVEPEPWIAGQPLYQERRDEPPMPDEIPE